MNLLERGGGGGGGKCDISTSTRTLTLVKDNANPSPLTFPSPPPDQEQKRKEFVANVKKSFEQVRLKDTYARLVNRATDTSITIAENKKLLSIFYTHAKVIALGGGGAGGNSAVGSSVDPRAIHRWLQQHIRCHEQAKTAAESRSNLRLEERRSGLSPVHHEIESFIGTLTPVEAKRLAVIVGASISIVRASAANLNEGGAGYNVPHIEASHRKVLSLISAKLTRQVLAEAGSMFKIVSASSLSSSDSSDESKQALVLPTTVFSSFDEVRLLFEGLRFANTPAESPLTSAVTSLGMAWLTAHSHKDHAAIASMAELAAANTNRQALASFVGVGGDAGKRNFGLPFSSPSSLADRSAISPLAASTSSRTALLKPATLREIRSMFQQLADPRWIESPLLHIIRAKRGKDGDQLTDDASIQIATNTASLSLADTIFACAAKVAKRRIYKNTGRFAFLRRQVTYAKSSVEHYEQRMEALLGSSCAESRGVCNESASSDKANQQTDFDNSCLSDPKAFEAQKAHLNRKLYAAKRKHRLSEAKLRAARAIVSADIRVLLGLYLDGLAVGQRSYLMLRSSTMKGSSLVGPESLVGTGAGARGAEEDDEGEGKGLVSDFSLTSSDLVRLSTEWNVRQQRMGALLQRLLFAPPSSKLAVFQWQQRQRERGGVSNRSSPATEPIVADELRQSVAFGVGELAKFLEASLYFSEHPSPSSAFPSPSSAGNRKRGGEEEEDLVGLPPVTLEERIAHYLLNNKDFSSLGSESASIRLLERMSAASGQLVPIPVLSDYASVRNTEVSLPPLIPESKLLSRVALLSVEAEGRGHHAPHLTSETSRLGAGVPTTKGATEGNDSNRPLPLPAAEATKAGEEEGRDGIDLHQTSSVVQSLAEKTTTPPLMGTIAPLKSLTPIQAIAADRSARLTTVKHVHDLIARLSGKEKFVVRNGVTKSLESISKSTPRPSTVLALLAMCDPKAAYEAHNTLSETLENMRTRVHKLEKRANAILTSAATPSSSQERLAAGAEGEDPIATENEKGNCHQEVLLTTQAQKDPLAVLAAKANSLTTEASKLSAAADILESTLGPALPQILDARDQSWLLQQLTANAATSNASYQQVARIMRNVVANFNMSVLDPITISDVFHTFNAHKYKMEVNSALLVLDSLVILERRAEEYHEKLKAQLDSIRCELDEIHFSSSPSNSKHPAHTKSKKNHHHVSLRTTAQQLERKRESLLAAEKRLSDRIRNFSVEAYRFPVLKDDMAQAVRKSVKVSADTATVPAISNAANALSSDSAFLDNDDGSLPDAMRSSYGALAAGGAGGGAVASSGGLLTVRSVRQIVPIMRQAYVFTPKVFSHLSRYLTGSVCVTNPSLALALQQAATMGDDSIAEGAMNRLPPMVLATHVFITDAELFAREFKARNKFSARPNRRDGNGNSDPSLTLTPRLLPTRSERDAALFLEYFVVSADGKSLMPRPEAAFFTGGSGVSSSAAYVRSKVEGAADASGRGEGTSLPPALSPNYSSPATHRHHQQQQTLYDVLVAFTTMASEYTSTASGDAVTYERRLRQAARAESRYRGSTFESVLWPTIRSHVLGEGSIVPMPIPLAEEEVVAEVSTVEGGEGEENASSTTRKLTIPKELPRHPITLSLREVTALFGAFAYIDISDTLVLSALVRRVQRMWRSAVEAAKLEAEEEAKFGGSLGGIEGSSGNLDSAANDHSASPKALVPYKALLAWANSLDAPTATAVLSSLLDGATDATFIRLLSPALVARLAALAHTADEESYRKLNEDKKRERRIKRRSELREAMEKQQQGRGRAGQTTDDGDEAAALAGGGTRYVPAPVPPIIEILYPSDVLHLMPTLITMMRHYDRIYGELTPEPSFDESTANTTTHHKQHRDAHKSNSKGSNNTSNSVILASLAPALPPLRVQNILKSLHDLYEGCRQALFIMFGSLKLTPIERFEKEQKALMASGQRGGDGTAEDPDSLATIASPEAVGDDDETLPLPSVPTSYYIHLLRRLLHSDLRDAEVADVCFKMITRTGHILQQLNGTDFRDVMHAALVFRGSVEDNVDSEDAMRAYARWYAKKNEEIIENKMTNNKSEIGEEKKSPGPSSPPPPPLLELLDEQTVQSAKTKRRVLFKPLVDHLWLCGRSEGIGGSEQPQQLRRRPTAILTNGDKSLLLRWMHSKFGFVDDELILQLGMDAHSGIHKISNVPPPPQQDGVNSSSTAEQIITDDKYAADLAAFKARKAKELEQEQREKATRSSSVSSSSAPPAQSEDLNQHMSADNMFLFGDDEDSSEPSGPMRLTAVNDPAAAALDAEDAYSKTFFEATTATDEAEKKVATPPPPLSDAVSNKAAALSRDDDLWDDLLMLEDDGQ